MFIVIGATGHVGSHVVGSLLAQGRPVTAVTRKAGHADALRSLGADIATADIADTEALRAVLRSGKRAFLLNPPAAPDTYTDAVEKETVRQLLAALDGSGLEKVVGQSTLGAQPGEDLGDLNTLWSLEEGLRSQPIPHSILRGAYYMSNWDAMLEPAKKDGVVPTMYPAGLEIPMAAPEDLGRAAAQLLTDPVESTGVYSGEGPRSYSSADVADAFAAALGTPVEPVVTPRESWKDAYMKLGFSEPAAHSYTRMTAITVDGEYDVPERRIRGSVTLDEYVGDLVDRSKKGGSSWSHLFGVA